MRRVSSAAALLGGGADDDGGSSGEGRADRVASLPRSSRQSFAAEVVRRWTTAEGDPDFDAFAEGLFGYYGNGEGRVECCGGWILNNTHTPPLLLPLLPLARAPRHRGGGGRRRGGGRLSACGHGGGPAALSARPVVLAGPAGSLAAAPRCTCGGRRGPPHGPRRRMGHRVRAPLPVQGVRRLLPPRCCCCRRGRGGRG